MKSVKMGSHFRCLFFAHYIVQNLSRRSSEKKRKKKLPRRKILDLNIEKLV